MENFDLLYNLIKYKTVYGNKEEFDACFKYIEEYLSNYKLNVKKVKYKNNISLIITNTKSKDFDVIFCGHLDVVAADEKLFLPIVSEDRLYGRGSYDMKGSLSVMIEIMKEFAKSTKKIALLITSDEERGGFYGTKKILENNNFSSKIAIVPDAGNDFELITEEKGVLQLKISVKGKEAHSSQLWRGINANEELINTYKKLIDIYEKPKSFNDWKTSINLSHFYGGEYNSINKVPKSAFMILDIRHIPENSKEEILQNIKNINHKLNIKELAKGEEFTTNIDNEYINKYIKASEKILMRKIKKKKCESSSDARFFYSYNIPCILMNPKGKNAHSKNEYIELSSLKKLFNIYKKFLNEL